MEPRAPGNILTLNAGSSSLKFALFRPGEPLARVVAGKIERIGLPEAELSVTDLESGFTRFDRDQASLAYSQAYFAAKYLLDQKGGYNVRRLLEAMATAATIDAAFRQALGMPYPDFERHMLAALDRAAG